MKPQTATVLQHLKHNGEITPLIARTYYRIESLSKRISELKNEYGYRIHAIWKKDPTGKRYRFYFIDEVYHPCSI